MQVRLRVGHGGAGRGLLRWPRNDPVAAQLSILPAEPGQSEMSVTEVVQAVLNDARGVRQSLRCGDRMAGCQTAGPR